jgi:hypothetical protein
MSLPSQPTNLSVSKGTELRQIILTWNPPTESPETVTQYVVSMSTSSGVTWRQITSNYDLMCSCVDNTYTMKVNNISSTTPCLFKVEAKSSEGIGLPITSQQPVYSLGTSTTVTNLVATRTADGFSLSWNPPVSDPNGITSYTITYVPVS